MKILGSAGEGQLLLSASYDEVANLVGYHSKYSDGARGHLEPGSEIKISEMYRTLYAIACNRKALEECAAKLRVCADTLDLTDPVIKQVIPPHEGPMT